MKMLPCLAATLWLTVPTIMNAQDLKNPAAEINAALVKEDYDKVIELTKDLDEDSLLVRYRAEAFHQRGVQKYFDADVKGSIADFDAYLAIRPDRDPYHWQRGISYYHAGEFAKGKAQFERHQTVNPQDVENAVFHFICAVRAPGGSVEEARKNFIEITRDTRIPMKEIHAFYAGKGTAEEVIEAAKAGEPSPRDLRNHLMYAHLYLGLYYDATGDEAKAAEHMKLAAEDYKMDHYMGQVAQVHVKLKKGGTDAKKPN